MAQIERQVAALPWRVVKGELEILLISSRETKRWIVPKGWPMPGLSNAHAARQEAFEEAGVTGSIQKVPCGHYTYFKREPDGATIHMIVDVFPLKVTRLLKSWPETHERSRQWFPVMEAASLVDELELRALIAQFYP